MIPSISCYIHHDDGKIPVPLEIVINEMWIICNGTHARWHTHMQEEACDLPSLCVNTLMGAPPAKGCRVYAYKEVSDYIYEIGK